MIDQELEVASTSASSADLRDCADLFMAFDFPALTLTSASLIRQGCEFGDPHAFRCFARLCESLSASWDAVTFDLVELLRDYFRACEQPIVTEAGHVCRLFLKLVFGDLVRRIARATPGDRFSLQKSDPLCGGAFAVLDGDFAFAEHQFKRAAGDPVDRTYAYAGIGLLRLFDTDDAGALDAFEQAGLADEDIGALVASMRLEAEAVPA